MKLFQGGEEMRISLAYCTSGVAAVTIGLGEQASNNDLIQDGDHVWYEMGRGHNNCQN